MSGRAGDVVQARDVSGGVHIYSKRDSPGPIPRQLPGLMRGFVNRSRELERLDRAFEREDGDQDAATVLLITGTAGVGKTSLAVHWAHRKREHFPDGQLYVNLRGYDPGEPVTPEYALDQFLRSLGTPDRALPADIQAKAALYRSLVADRSIMILLDNAATVEQVRPLLPGTVGCLAIVTSRGQLPGLVAREGAYRIKVGTLSEAEAVSLLRLVTRGYRDSDTAEDLAELARLCAYLPLALRIAAERAAARPQMTLSDLIQDLRDESSLWDALSSEGDPEADGVRTVFAWSYRALPEDAARMFRLLGLHPGPEFGIAAAAATADTTPAVARHALDTLVGVHLVEQSAPERYQFHDLLHAYAIDQAHHGESLYSQHATLQRILSWYLHTANAAADALEYNPQPISLEPYTEQFQPLRFNDYAEALRWCEAERSNLVNAVRVAAQVRLDAIAWRIHAVLREYYSYRCHYTDWFTTGQIALEAVRRQNDRYGEAIILESLGKAYRQTNQLDDARQRHEEALRIRHDLGDRPGEARSLNALGLVCRQDGDLDRAVAWFEQAISLAESAGQEHWLMVATANLGEALVQAGDSERAEASLDNALSTTLRLGSRHFQYECYKSLGRLKRRPDTSAALELLGHAIRIARELEDKVLEGVALTDYAAAQLADGRPGDALLSYQGAAAVHRQYGGRRREAIALSGTGEAYRRLRRFEEAVSFQSTAIDAFRDFRDRRCLAMSLDRKAIALFQKDDADQARECWLEASAVIAAFSDPRASALGSRIAACLAGADRDLEQDLGSGIEDG